MSEQRDETMEQKYKIGEKRVLRVAIDKFDPRDNCYRGIVNGNLKWFTEHDLETNYEDDLSSELERLRAENSALKEANRWIPTNEQLPEDG